MPFETPPEQKTVLRKFSDRLFAARREFLRDHFDGYVADTYYFEPDGEHYCWPAQSDGFFEGFTDLTEAENSVVGDLERHGFSLLGVGASRICLECPFESDEELVVKIGRCGMGSSYVQGRQKILTEYQISQSHPELPVVPCLYCDPKGRFGLYPRAESIGSDGIDSSTVDTKIGEIEERVEKLRRDEIGAIENLGRVDDEIRVLDYCDFEDVEYPLGVPSHIDSTSIVRRVDELRKRGEKLDIRQQGEMVEPSVTSD